MQGYRAGPELSGILCLKYLLAIEPLCARETKKTRGHEGKWPGALSEEQCNQILVQRYGQVKRARRRQARSMFPRFVCGAVGETCAP